MRRVGLLGLLLVVALGSGAVAQEPSPEASPEATTLYAPEDLASVIPGSISEVELMVMGDSGEGGQEFIWGPDIESDFLLLLGKEPGDVRQAVGQADPIEVGGAVIALRVDGVDGEVMLDALVEALLLRPEVSADPPSIESEWLDIDGRRVQMVSTAGEPTVFLYPKGEVGFVVALAEGGELTIEDVMAELP